MGASLEIRLRWIIAPQAVDESTERATNTGMESAGAESYPGLEVHMLKETQEPHFQTTLKLSCILQTS